MDVAYVSHSTTIRENTAILVKNGGRSYFSRHSFNEPGVVHFAVDDIGYMSIETVERSQENHDRGKSLDDVFPVHDLFLYHMGPTGPIIT
jgi:hypothetical protein